MMWALSTRLGVRAERLLDPALPLAPDLGGAVAVVDVEAGGEEVVEQGVGQCADRTWAARPPNHHTCLRDLVEPAVEVGQQA